MTAAAKAETNRYRQEIDALIRTFLAGNITRSAFQRAFIAATDRHHIAMYSIGGSDPTTAEARKILADAKRQTEKSARSLAKSIVEATTTLTITAILSKLRSRLDLWQNTGLGMFDDGVVNAPNVAGSPEIKLRWDFDPYKEHCRDCAALDGVVLTKSEWKQLGIRPRSPQLECGGWHCGCTRNETDEESHGLEAVKSKLGI